MSPYQTGSEKSVNIKRLWQKWRNYIKALKATDVTEHKNNNSESDSS